MDSIRVLVVTSQWPSCEAQTNGIHVVSQVNRLRELGHRVDVFSYRGHKNPVRYLKAIRDLLRIDLHQYDLIHAHHGQSGLVALAQNCVPVVVTFHGSDLQGLRSRSGQNLTPTGLVLRRVSQHVAVAADEVIVVAEHLATYISRPDYHVIPIGTDMGLFCPRPQKEAREALGLPLDVPLVLFVGDTRRPEKRYALAAQVMQLISQRTGSQLVVAQNVPYSDMPLYMNACDALLVTSASEGSPSAVKEALACNLPIVSVDVGDVRQRISSIDGCVICVDDRPETISFQLERSLQRKQRSNGREEASALDERTLIGQVISVYQRAISKKSDHSQGEGRVAQP